MPTSSPSTPSLPIWGLLSVALTPAGAVFAALAAAITDAVVDKPPGVTMSAWMPGLARVVVMTIVACVAAGVIAGIVAMVRRERPRWLPIVGLVSTACLIALFDYLSCPG